MSEELAVEKLKEKFPEAIVEVSAYAGQTWVRLKKENIVEVCTFLRDDPDLAFAMLTDLCGVDYPSRRQRFDVVYQLYSLEKNCRLRLKAAVGEEETIDTVIPVWKGANWLEREAYDMFGIQFEGHPNLTRILLPDDWNEGFPLRKEYPIEGTGEYKSYKSVRR
jgi:NADH/F420H2 dehydrogenase subunit C